MKSPLTFVHVSDTHFGPTSNYKFFSSDPLRCAERFVEIVNEMPIPPAFVMHTGDVATNHDDDAYRLAQKVFSHLTVPIYYVTGNHDLAPDIRRFLTMGRKDDAFSGDGALAYSFSFGGCRFVVLDGHVPEEIGPHGELPADQLEFLRKECSTGKDPLFVFGHFPAFQIYSPWSDAHLLLTNGEEMHAVLKSAGSRLKGYFYGHIHHSRQQYRDGVMYCSAPSTCYQFGPRIDDVEGLTHDPEALPGYSLVTLDEGLLTVRQHSFARP